jgi:hypothetical protein
MFTCPTPVSSRADHGTPWSPSPIPAVPVERFVHRIVPDVHPQPPSSAPATRTEPGYSPTMVTHRVDLGRSKKMLADAGLELLGGECVFGVRNYVLIAL